jgi:dCTP deaminase
MMLSDYEIGEAYYTGSIDIEPFDPNCIQPASYDVHLGDKLLVPDRQVKYSEWWADPLLPRTYDGLQLNPCDSQPPFVEKKLPPYNSYLADEFYLPPGGVALGHTDEIVTLQPDSPIAADIAGCSSLGRWFLFVHVTAGFIDPGWSGQLTLELYNASPWWLRLWAGMRIAQIRFYRMGRISKRPYSVAGHYAGSIGPVESRYTA